MSKAKNWAVVNLAGGNGSARVMWLEIEGIGTFDVVQATLNWALNEIPRASCLVAIGRNARDITKQADVSQLGLSLKQMKNAKLYFSPQGEWDPNGTYTWSGTQVVFEGKYLGLAYRKVMGKLQPVLNLVHWLCDLGWSSMLSANQLTSNPTSLVDTAITTQTAGDGIGGQPNNTPDTVSNESIRGGMGDGDLWSGVKDFFCGLTQDDKFRIVNTDCTDGCEDDVGVGKIWDNMVAQNALKRIEGPGESVCTADYVYGKPLEVDTLDVALVEDSIANAILQETLEPYAGTSFWDAIVGMLCPAFQLALIPLVSSAILAADTPAYRGFKGLPWRSISPDEYDSIDMSGMLTKPLQGVGIYENLATFTGVDGQSQPGSGEPDGIGGYWHCSTEYDSDGAWLVRRAPAWLSQVSMVGQYAGSSSGAKQKMPNYTATTDEPAQSSEDPTLDEIKTEDNLCALYTRFAHSLFVDEALRGRFASISGKLRFDIAPGSLIRIEPKPELFADGVDELAVPLWGHVVRVTTNINSEAGQCSTSMELSHVRTESENSEDRCTVAQHPLFTEGSILLGAPLVPAWEMF